MNTFTSSPLITPERLTAAPQEALSVRRPWLHVLHLELPEGHKEDPARFTPSVTIVMGKEHKTSKGLTPVQVALMLELTRFPGASIVTNSNGQGRWYVRISFAGYPEDLTMMSRVFSNGAEYDQTKVGIIQSDMRTENLRNETAEKIGKDARQVVLGHIERIARKWEASGRMPDHLTMEAYLENIHRLFHLCDLEATGKELSDLLPLIPEAPKNTLKP